MKRSFLFLQGPHGPFFRLLGRRLKNEGHRVTRINFNGGDLFDWTGPETISFREKAEVWPDFLAEFIRKDGTTDLVSFGDCRPLLETGIQVARNAGVRCRVFEEGYIRPNLITLEKDGVNGKSNLPKDPDWFLEQANRLPKKSTIKHTDNSMSAMMYHVSVYYTAKLAAQSFFPNFKSHRPYNEWSEIRCWALKLLSSTSTSNRNRQFQKRFLTSGRRFFMFCLQLGSDSQIHHHSSFGSMKNAIVKVLTSFANNLQGDTALLVKNHPLDPGIVNMELFTLNLAKELDIADRVFFTEGGDLPAYIKSAEGIIVVNSTVGMSSLHLKRPTMAMGKAIYAIPGLVNCDGLNSFWSHPVPPDGSLYNAFRNVLIHKTQIDGGFYTKEGIRTALPEAGHRLLHQNGY